MDRPHAAGDRIVADAVRRSAAEHAQRAAHLSRRAAAARRRALLTALLLVVGVTGWSVVGLTAASVLVGAVPTVLLAGVLVLGRRAVVAGRRADAAWAAGAADRLPLSRTAHVIGRAVHPSDAATEVMARVPAQAPVRRSAVARAEAERAAQEAVAAEREAGASAAGAAAPTEAVAAEPTWAPVPVPRPTYTLKPAAPRREPAPLTAEDLAPARTATAAEPQDVGTEEAAEVQEPAAAAAPTAGPALDLDAVLARRRASGE